MLTNKRLNYFNELMADIEDEEWRELGELLIFQTNRKDPYTDEELYSGAYIWDGVVRYSGSYKFDFHSETDCFYRPVDKWEILMAAYHYYPDKADELVNIYKKHYPECKELIIEPESLRNNNFGDRQLYVIFDYFNEKKISFEEFIFNPSYIVVINTNNNFRKLVYAGIFEKNNIIDFADEYYFRDGEPY